MRGINNNTKEALNRIIEELFDRMAVSLLGHIPFLNKKKSILFSYNPSQTLAYLFVQALGATRLLPKEEEVVKNLLSTAFDYVEALKSKTKANLTNSIDAYVKETRAKGLTPSEFEIKKKINESLLEAGKHLKVISESESTKARNMGKLISIAKVGASIGQIDPDVFFVIVKDKDTCDECLRLHSLPDRITPRVWKMSELGYSYHKKGDTNPKVPGLHPHCRCTLTLLSKGFGFKNGKVSFISENHNEYEKQNG